MKKIGSEVCSVSWDVGSGWVGTHAWCNMERCVRWKSYGLRFCGVSLERWFRVGTHAWCNMESCSGKVQKRNVWDENLGVWGFVVCLWNVGSGWVGTHAWCNLFWVVPAKFETGMCEMKIFGSEVYSVSWDVGLGWVGSHAWCSMESVPAKFKTDVWDENLTVWGFVMYLCEVGSGWVGTNAWCNMESCSGKVQKRDVWDESLRPKDVKFSGVSLGLWFRMGWHKCVV